MRLFLLCALSLAPVSWETATWGPAAWGQTPPELRDSFLYHSACAERLLDARFLKSGLVPAPWDSLWYFSKDTDFLQDAVFDKEAWPQMNIRVLEPANWLTIKAEPKAAYTELLQRRRRILENSPRDKVVLSLPDPEIRDAAMALLLKTVKFLVSFHGDYYRQEGSWIENQLTGDRFNLEDPQLDPLATFALLTTNDLLIARVEAEDLRLVAGAVLFTASWNPNSLMGTQLRQIHDMEGATEKFHGGVSKVMERLQKYADVTVLRNNWFWRTDPTLFQHLEMDWIFPSLAFGPARSSNIGHRLYLRMERETFASIPGFPKYIAFTLDSKVYPLRAVGAYPEVAARALAGLNKNPGGTVLSSHTALLRRYLEQRAVAAP
jgi:hypothetical protein